MHPLLAQGRPLAIAVCLMLASTAASAESWYYVNFAAGAKSTAEQCTSLPAGLSPLASLTRQHGTAPEVLSDRTAADQSRTMVLATASGTRYAFATTTQACQVFRRSVVAENTRRANLDQKGWYVAQLTRGDCIPMKEMFGGVGTPEDLHRQLTKNGDALTLERRGERVRLISFDRRQVPPLHLVQGMAACEDYVRR